MKASADVFTERKTEIAELFVSVSRVNLFGLVSLPLSTGKLLIIYQRKKENIESYCNDSVIQGHFLNSV